MFLPRDTMKTIAFCGTIMLMSLFALTYRVSVMKIHNHSNSSILIP